MAEPDEVVRLLARLWEPTPENLIAKLPRGVGDPTTRKKGKCNDCDGYHDLPAIHLDYLGHADACRILASVDPFWSWAPKGGWEETGEPRFIRDSSGYPTALWIDLTVLNVTRPGIGTVGSGKSDPEKELIGDAIRNAAMRFGVGADLWSKAKGGGLDDSTEGTYDRAPKQSDPDAWFKENGWKDRAEERAWRDTFTAKGTQLADEDRAAFKEDCAGAGFVWAEPIPKHVADEVDKFFAMYLAPASRPAEATQPPTQSLAFTEGEET